MKRAEDGRARDDLDMRLDELANYQTHTPFSQLYCRLIAAWSREAGGGASGLRDACGRFLDVELWYHQMLANLSDRERVTRDDLRSVADKRRIGLTALTEKIQALGANTSRANVVKHLLLAECHYHLRETRSVVSELEAAIESGGGHPLVHFALGYNRFDRARETYAAFQMSSEADVERAEEEFRTACIGAVDAFRDGLSGQVFDAQLHFWIGRALAAAGLIEEAEAALETASRIDSSIFGQRPIVEDTEDEGDASIEPRGERETAIEPVESEPPPITEEEVRQFGELVKRPWRPEDLLSDQ